MTRAAARNAASLLVLASLVAGLVAVMGTHRVAGGRRAQHPYPPPFLIFRTLSSSDRHGHVAIVPVPHVETPPLVSRLSCARVHYAGGHGLCIQQESAGNELQHVAYVFDKSLAPGARILLRGVPTRVRVAPDGKRAAITTYAEEETPAGERLATETVIVELPSGLQLADVREFPIDTARFAPVKGPIDVSSVAFDLDGDRFFAAVSASGERYLVSGSLAHRAMTALRAGIASESLSPDGALLVIKKPREQGVWQLAVLDVRTWKERDLNQGSRSVDDQVEWFGNQHVMFHDTDGETTSLWVLSVDGSGPPRVLLKDAYSGAVQW